MEVDVSTETVVARPLHEVAAYLVDAGNAPEWYANIVRVEPLTPLPLTTEYAWQEVDGGTRVTLRNHGEPSGFAGVAAPMMRAAMRRADRADLARLRSVLER